MSKDSTSGRSAGGAAGWDDLDGGSSDAPDGEGRESRESEMGGELGPGDSRVAQDLLLKALSVGLSGLFSTQEALRKVVGDAMPPEWLDYASQQSDRARDEFFERMSDQMSAVIQEIDVKELLAAVMEDHVLEMKASFRLRPSEPQDETKGSSLELGIKPPPESGDL